jgi:hypothetical protein
MRAKSEINPYNRWEIKTITSFEEIEAIRDIWIQMLRGEYVPALNTDIERYLSVMESLKESAQPYILVLYDNNDPKAIVIGRIEMKQITCRVGYATIFKPSLRCLTVVYGGILGNPSEQASLVILKELTDTLKRGDIDTVFFNQLQLDSLIYRLTKKKPGFLSRNFSPVVEPHWQTCLPDSVEAFYKGMSGSRKRYVRRYTKALEKAGSGPVEIVCYRSEDKLDDVIKIASEMTAKTYKQALDVGFRDDSLTRSLLTKAAKQGQLRAYVLYVNSKPCAFEYGIEYGNVFFPEHIGYDPFFRSCSPGTILFIKVVEDLIENSDVRVFDYGFGAAAYKERFGTKSWQEASVYIFAPRLYPIVVNALQNSIMYVDFALKCILNKFSAVSWIKRYWRNLLRPKSA